MPFQIPTHIWHTGEQKGKGCQGSGTRVKNQGELGTAKVTLTPCNLYKFLSRCFVYLWVQWGQPVGLRPDWPQLCSAPPPAQSPTSI